MANPFSEFKPETGSAVLEQPIVNSEMDDLDMPAGADLPSIEDFQMVDRAVRAHIPDQSSPAPSPSVSVNNPTAVGLGSLSKRPPMLAAKTEPLALDTSIDLGEIDPDQQKTATQEPPVKLESTKPIVLQPSSSFYKDSADTGMSKTSDSNSPLGEAHDMLSQASDVHRIDTTVTDLKSQLTAMNQRLNTLVEVDAKQRALDQLISTLTQRLNDASTSYSNLYQSFTTYQQRTAATIADLERRMATDQIRRPDEVMEPAIIPPSIVVMERSAEAPAAGGQAPVAPMTSVVPAVARVIDLSDWD